MLSSMKPLFILLILIILLLLGVSGMVLIRNRSMTESPDLTPSSPAGTIRLTSSAFQDNGSIPAKYTCDGENISPPLTITGVPKEATSLVLIMDDPDAPMGTWDHWVVFNIPPDIRAIEEAQEPPGVHGQGTRNTLVYGGPCPPDREHRYFFKLYALDTNLDLAEGVTKKEVEQAMEGHVIDSMQLVGRYDRR